jgi:hypothetical protein
MTTIYAFGPFEPIVGCWESTLHNAPIWFSYVVIPKNLVITDVYRFKNGNVLVFDQYGQQMPGYQGLWDEVEQKIREAGYTRPIYIYEWSSGSGWGRAQVDDADREGIVITVNGHGDD